MHMRKVKINIKRKALFFMGHVCQHAVISTCAYAQTASHKITGTSNVLMRVNPWQMPSVS